MNRRLAAVLPVLLMIASCGKDSPTVAPTVPAPACQTNNTATVQFWNTSNRADQDVVWDGVLIIRLLARGQRSEPPLVATAGVAHTVSFRQTGLATVACAQAAPILVQCTNQVITCAFP